MTDDTRTSPSIAFINNTPGLLGGGEVQLLTLLRGLPREAIGLTVVCCRGSALEVEAKAVTGVTVVPASFGGVSVRAIARSIERELDHPDIVQGTGFLTNIIARQLGPAVGACVINTVHVVPGAARLDGESWAKGLVRSTLDRSSRGRVDRFVAVSDAVANRLIADGAKPEKVTVIHNGLELDRLRAAARVGDASRTAGGIRVGYLGRLESVKGCEYFVLSAALLAERYPSTEFVVAGDGSERANLEGLATRVGVAEKVRFLGYVEDGAALLAGVDVVVVPSLSEASGLTAVEAMALGVPLVATNVGGLPEVVIDGETGLLVPPADPDAMAAAISRLLDDPALASRLAENGMRRADQVFAAERMVAQYVDLYRELAC